MEEKQKLAKQRRGKGRQAARTAWAKAFTGAGAWEFSGNHEHQWLWN